jgi:hypothetical protein
MVFLCVTTLSRMDQDVRSCRASFPETQPETQMEALLAAAGGPCEDPGEVATWWELLLRYSNDGCEDYHLSRKMITI